MYILTKITNLFEYVTQYFLQNITPEHQII